MVTPTASKPSSQSNNKPAQEPQKPVAVQEPPAPEAKVALAAHDAGKAETTIISITVSTRLASKARLLAKIRGVTISSLFTDGAAKTIPAALKAALADLKDQDD